MGHLRRVAVPSITTWTRLEPRTRKPENMTIGLQARVHDPLWFLARQWQLGEFQAEDAGSALSATVTAQAARLTSYQSLASDLGPITHEQIALRAYYLFLARQRACGHALDDWLNAERELKAEAAAASSPPQPYNPRVVPLETLVERESTPRGSGANLRQSAEAGLHFLRLLDLNQEVSYRAHFINDFAL